MTHLLPHLFSQDLQVQTCLHLLQPALILAEDNEWKSPSINHSDLELPIWLRPTSRPTVSLGTMTGLEVTKADASLHMTVIAGQRNIPLVHSVGRD